MGITVPHINEDHTRRHWIGWLSKESTVWDEGCGWRKGWWQDSARLLDDQEDMGLGKRRIKGNGKCICRNSYLYIFKVPTCCE
jgi:hypothetical protein